LVIALGGIATGVGAIWTAVVTRRLVHATEDSLAEQSQSLREQNERARLTLEYDLLTRLEDRIESPHFLRRRRAAAKYFLDEALVDDNVVIAERLTLAAGDVCGVLEEVGEMLRVGVLRAEPVWNRYGGWAQAYWSAGKPTIEKMREEAGDPTIYENLEYLCRVLDEMDRKRGLPPPRREWLRNFMEWETGAGDEPPTPPEGIA
jgi:hypothetical protein